MSETIYDSILIGSGMGSLTTAALLVNQGAKVLILEQNYLPGGCTSSYWRKGFVFESGATTLVGLDKGMPLDFVLRKTGIKINAIPLAVPMKVILKTGKIITRYQNLDKWIVEAEKAFGIKGQKEFWNCCYDISKAVWTTSTKQTSFPPENLSDFWKMMQNVSFEQIKSLPFAFLSTQDLLKRFGLDKNEEFCEFIDEQLIITAQNNRFEVNALFGGASLCYTNYGNYYIEGGLINLVNPFIEYIKNRGGALKLRENVIQVEEKNGVYSVKTDKNEYKSKILVSGIPLNNTLEIYPGANKNLKQKLLTPKDLNSAFQIGIAFKSNKTFECLHHQIHLKTPIIGLSSKSIFLSLNHPSDKTRSDENGILVGSVSTHLSNPGDLNLDKTSIKNQIIDILVENGFFDLEDLIYSHSSADSAWEKWTGRKWGFVGGYPQSMARKPWNMPGARLDGKRAYICGDSVYPGQGIPGVTLSGIIAAAKISFDTD